ncbi:MAG: hypothetical protein Edafosvirus42_4 [Edafosvirus sp.]|uniref:Uncharacterized protein n=1 Tax=Edafosvirus sp. TaxID=2487765 RepID=A0A3G4ZVF8_9VIRU|nr:MAG: hypothetical protein Edafosvirus42_4 [Edafosvirus sp.]
MDNFFKECPAMMSDGRIFTDWRSHTRRDEYIKYKNGIIRDDVYRLFLQENASKFMDNEWNFNKKQTCWVNECVFKSPTRTYPGFFAIERKAYDSLFDPNRKVQYPCNQYPDYRMGSDKV